MFCCDLANKDKISSDIKMRVYVNSLLIRNLKMYLHLILFLRLKQLK